MKRKCNFPEEGVMRTVCFMLAVLAFCTEASETPVCQRVFRPERYTRGNTGIGPVQPIDHAAWVSHEKFAGDVQSSKMGAMRLRRSFTSDGSDLKFDVTADEHFRLWLDGRMVAQGPHRGSLENWLYQTYSVTMPPGEHIFDAVVWKGGNTSPWAQVSYQLGFCLKADGAYDALLTTGKADWQVGDVSESILPMGHHGGPFATGTQYKLLGTGVWDAQPHAWSSAVVIRQGLDRLHHVGASQFGWRLYPSQLKDLLAKEIRPGKIVQGGELKFPLVVPAGEKRTLLWDLSNYYCAYPEAVVSGGKNGSLTWRWAESLLGPADDKGERFKGRRDEWRGKAFDGFGDTFVFDGRQRAVFSPPWWRCGRWCEVVIDADKAPVIVEDLHLLETRYPLECETQFSAVGHPELEAIQRIAVRTQQMCAHDLLFDCPFYEQQMYPADSRLQGLSISAITSDDALIRRALNLFDCGRREDDLSPFNFPTHFNPQEGSTYSFLHVLMYSDYLMNHTNRDWLRCRLPGIRATMSALELYERADGLLGKMPGWCFMDWTDGNGWREGVPPGGWEGGVSCEINLMYLLALQASERIENAYGNVSLAEHYRMKAERLGSTTVKTFFDGERGLMASDEEHLYFSEHAQCLAIVGDVVTGDGARRMMDTMLKDGSLAKVTVSFSHFLFDALFKIGRPSVFLERLKLWQSFVDKGAMTCLEWPEYEGHDSRSDCHAWGAHPLWHLRTGIAGIRSAAPFYSRVKVAPQPGPLASIRSSYPHPSGTNITVSLSFADGFAEGRITTPVPGTFEYNGQIVPLNVGDNDVGLRDRRVQQF